MTTTNNCVASACGLELSPAATNSSPYRGICCAKLCLAWSLLFSFDGGLIPWICILKWKAPRRYRTKELRYRSIDAKLQWMQILIWSFCPLFSKLLFCWMLIKIWMRKKDLWTNTLKMSNKSYRSTGSDILQGLWYKHQLIFLQINPPKWFIIPQVRRIQEWWIAESFLSLQESTDKWPLFFCFSSRPKEGRRRRRVVSGEIYPFVFRIRESVVCCLILII